MLALPGATAHVTPCACTAPDPAAQPAGRRPRPARGAVAQGGVSAGAHGVAGLAWGPPTAAHTAPLKVPPRTADADGSSELVVGAVDLVVSCPELP